MPGKKDRGPLPPIRIRHEPPTVEEAAAAAVGLTDDVEQQVEIAAGLIGWSRDETRPHVLSAQRTAASRPDRAGPAERAVPTVVIKRRSFLKPDAPGLRSTGLRAAVPARK